MSDLRQDDEDFVELPPERRTLPRVVVVIALLAAALIVVGFGVRGWYQGKVDPPGEPGKAVTVEIERGATLSGVGGVLADKDVITNATIFRFWARDKEIEVQAGTYRFREDSSFDEVLEVIRDGPAPPPVERVTIPEGLTMHGLTEVLADTDRPLRAAADAGRTERSGHPLDVPATGPGLARGSAVPGHLRRRRVRRRQSTS